MLKKEVKIITGNGSSTPWRRWTCIFMRAQLQNYIYSNFSILWSRPNSESALLPSDSPEKTTPNRYIKHQFWTSGSGFRHAPIFTPFLGSVGKEPQKRVKSDRMLYYLDTRGRYLSNDTLIIKIGWAVQKLWAHPRRGNFPLKVYVVCLCVGVFVCLFVVSRDFRNKIITERGRWRKIRTVVKTEIRGGIPKI